MRIVKRNDVKQLAKENERLNRENTALKERVSELEDAMSALVRGDTDVDEE